MQALLAAKETAKFRNIVEPTGGIVFVGCLHDENHLDLRDMCLKAAAVEFKTMKKHEAVESAKIRWVEPHLFKNEIARTTYKLGCVHQDMGNFVKGREQIRAAEKMRQEMVPAEDWAPHGEQDYDEIVQFWTRWGAFLYGLFL